MIRLARLRKPAILAAMSLGLGVSFNVGAHTLPAHASGGMATFTARYFAATVETDPVAGEAVGTLSCGTSVPDPQTGAPDTLGGACFNLSPFGGQGLFEITQVIPDGSTGTPTTTVFQGYDMNGDHCVACFAGDGDQAAESGGNGVVGDSIPAFPGPLQVFPRLLSLADDGTVRHSTTGIIQVTVLTAADFQAQCGTTSGGCGGPFQPPTVCVAPPAGPTGTCGVLPYPYPSNP